MSVYGIAYPTVLAYIHNTQFREHNTCHCALWGQSWPLARGPDRERERNMDCVGPLCKCVQKETCVWENDYNHVLRFFFPPFSLPFHALGCSNLIFFHFVLYRPTACDIKMENSTSWTTTTTTMMSVILATLSCSCPGTSHSIFPHFKPKQWHLRTLTRF